MDETWEVPSAVSHDELRTHAATLARQELNIPDHACLDVQRFTAEPDELTPGRYRLVLRGRAQAPDRPAVSVSADQTWQIGPGTSRQGVFRKALQEALDGIGAPGMELEEFTLAPV